MKSKGNESHRSSWWIVNYRNQSRDVHLWRLKKGREVRDSYNYFSEKKPLCGGFLVGLGLFLSDSKDNREDACITANRSIGRTKLWFISLGNHHHGAIGDAETSQEGVGFFKNLLLHKCYLFCNWFWKRIKIHFSITVFVKLVDESGF